MGDLPPGNRSTRLFLVLMVSVALLLAAFTIGSSLWTWMERDRGVSANSV